MTNVDMIEAEDALVSYARKWASMESANGCFTGAVVDYSRSCSWTPDRSCHIVRELASWNGSLFPARMQLQEIPGERGQLSLVSFADTGLYLQEPHDFQSWLSAGLMHRLLKHHRCVTSLYVTPLHFEKYTSLLSDALPHSRLKKLELKFWGFPVPKDICASIASLTSLNKLECTFFGDCCVEFPTALAELVRTSPSLVHLGLQGTSMGEQATKNLLTCLLEHGSLEQLNLIGSVIPENCRQELAKYLTFTASLTSFRFAADSHKTEIATLEASRQNNQREHIHHQFPDTFTERRSSLRSHEDLYNAWLEAIWKNEALQEFCVPYQIWNPQQWTRFSHILSSKHHLKKVCILSDSGNHNLLTHVCHTLEDGGVRDKVSCGVYFVEDNVDLLKCKMFSGLFFVADVRDDVKWDAMRQLQGCGHVTSVVLEIPRGNLAVSSALADYVQSTSALRKLEVSTGFSEESDFSEAWWRVFVQSLSKNNSIKELVVYVDSMSDLDVESLADAVNTSRNIRKLTFGDGSSTSLRAFVNRLSDNINDNRTLLSVVLEGRLDEGWQDATNKVAAVYEATRRNSGLLAAAASFSKATELDRYSTGALERVYKHHYVLLEDLAELADVGEAEIEGLVRRHLKRTASLDDYMRITGVVMERVVCHPLDDGRMQLDDLHEDCWALVRRYLLLDDIEEAVFHPECSSAAP
ncbi:hypothetical protein HPB50_004305 [Hyalomma asiaticum]|uniref:Uncharacterized protein n=1 Tax=Hyalomma asiaticum TaxID=266040 RepID=A0ACB7SR73_HYAAI|nr:hypothetical protein HPB50_004305 [Hyalomma asiaticum]